MRPRNEVEMLASQNRRAHQEASELDQKQGWKTRALAPGIVYVDPEIPSDDPEIPSDDPGTGR